MLGDCAHVEAISFIKLKICGLHLYEEGARGQGKLNGNQEL